MFTLEETIEKVGSDFTTRLADLLEKGRLRIGESKKIARDYLALEPFISFEDLRKKILAFTQTYPAFENIQTNFLQYLDNMHTDTVLNKMRSLIKNHQYDKALEVTK